MNLFDVPLSDEALDALLFDRVVRACRVRACLPAVEVGSIDERHALERLARKGALKRVWCATGHGYVPA